MSPRKVRLVIAVKGKMAVEAEELLPFISSCVASDLKLLKSAMANAENNFKLKADRMYIKICAPMRAHSERSMPRRTAEPLRSESADRI